MGIIHWSASWHLGNTPRHRRRYLHGCMCNQHHRHHPHQQHVVRRVVYVERPPPRRIVTRTAAPQRDDTKTTRDFKKAAKPQKKAAPKPAAKPETKGPVTRAFDDGRSVTTWPNGWTVTRFDSNATVVRTPDGHVAQITGPSADGPLVATPQSNVRRGTDSFGNPVYTSHDGFTVTDYVNSSDPDFSDVRDKKGNVVGSENRKEKGRVIGSMDNRLGAKPEGGKGADKKSKREKDKPAAEKGDAATVPEEVREEQSDMSRRLAKIFGLGEGQPLSGDAVRASWMEMSEKQKDAALASLTAFLTELMAGTFGPDYPVQENGPEPAGGTKKRKPAPTAEAAAP